MEAHLAEMLKLNAGKNPDKPAIVFKERIITYRELYLRSNRLANALSAFGYNPGDKIALLMENCTEFMESYFAITKIGLIPVSFSYLLTDSDFSTILTRSDSRCIIMQEKYAQRIFALDLPIEEYIIVDNEKSEKLYDKAHNYEALLNKASNDDPPNLDYSSTIMLHTSGTTGLPKGIIRSKWGFLNRAIEFDIQAEDRMLAIMPLCLSAGTVYTHLPLFIGATVYLMEKPEAELALRLIETERINSSMMVPTILNRILSAPDLKTYDLSSVRSIISGGGEIADDAKPLIEETFGQAISVYAASTEAGPYANLKPKDLLKKKGNCIGYPFYGVDLALLDQEGKEVPYGEVGEICVLSPFQFDEYYKDKEATDATKRGPYRTVGDLGRRDENNYIYFVGRERDVIKSGGINIYSPEIEEALVKHPSIKEAAVIGVPDPEWIEAIKAIVVVKEGEEVTGEELISFCKEKIASYKKPRSVEFVSELPRNLTGRVLKEELKNKYGSKL